MPAPVQPVMDTFLRPCLLGRRFSGTVTGDVALLALAPGASSSGQARPGSWLGVLLAAPVAGQAGEVEDLALARARQGDHLAFADIVRRYDERLRALAFRLLDDRDRMDDVLQEAYVKAYRALPRFRGASTLGTWLYRITYNACMDELRRAPSSGVGDSLDEDERPSTAPGPDEIAVRRVSLGAALSALPPDQRAAVLLVDADGLDHRAAAEVLGVRPGTVASRLSRARSRLRHSLGEGG